MGNLHYSLFDTQKYIWLDNNTIDQRIEKETNSYGLVYEYKKKEILSP